MGQSRPVLRAETLRERETDGPPVPAAAGEQHASAGGSPQRGEQRRLPLGASQLVRRVPTANGKYENCFAT